MTRISKRICTSGTFPRFPPEPSWSGKRRGHLSRWNGDLVHWRQENDVLATNGLITDDLRQYFGIRLIDCPHTWG